MRRYPHDPDEKFLRERLVDTMDRMNRSYPKAAAKIAEGKLLLFSTWVDMVFERTATGWGLEEPLPAVVEALERTTAFIDEALEKGFTPSLNEIGRWLEIALIGGDRDAAVELASALQSAAQGRSESPWSFARGLIALLRDQPDAAEEEARAMSQWFDSPACAPYEIAAYGCLDRLIAATAAVDQGAFDAAAADRARSVAEMFGVSTELRRNSYGLIDAGGSAVSRLALARGLTVPSDNPYLAGDLLASTPWPTEV